VNRLTGRCAGIRTRLKSRRDHGTVTPMMLVMAGGILILISLSFDGGNFYSDQQRAESVAQEAARAGAQDIDVDRYLATGRAGLSEKDARIDVTNYLSGVTDLAIKDVQVYFGPGDGSIQVTFLVDRRGTGVFLPASWWGADKVYGNAVVVLEQGVTSAGG